MPEVPAGIIEIHFKRGRCAVDPVMLLLDGFDRIIYIVIFVNHNLYFRIPGIFAAKSYDFIKSYYFN